MPVTDALYLGLFFAQKQTSRTLARETITFFRLYIVETLSSGASGLQI